MNNEPRVRWLTNVALNVKKTDGDDVTTIEKVFKSGSYILIDKVVLNSDGYGDIHLRGGEWVIEGIRLEDAVEIHGANALIEKPVAAPSPKRKRTKAR